MSAGLANGVAPTPAMLDVLHHTLGLTPQKRSPYRNHYLAGEGHHEMDQLTALEAAGLMARRKAPAFCDPGDIMFIATVAGKALALELLPPAPKRTKYDEYLHSECNESFAEFLGINRPRTEVREAFVSGRWQSSYRMARGGYRWHDSVSGDWCATKKAAKASYKEALRRSKAWRTEEKGGAR